ncbi:MAG: ABC transporter substrate-binding protein [Eubacteriales bacterium]|nr:ABC transporter substrate-binding protein [Eubacteriales bacterium]
MKKALSIVVLVLMLLSLFACSELEELTEGLEQDAKSETSQEADAKAIIVGQTWVTGSLDPTDGGNPWGLTSHGITEAVFMQNQNGELESRFVKSFEQVSDLEWELILNEDVYFSDGSLVDAKAFCEALNTVSEKNLFSDATAGKMEFSPEDEFRVLVKTERKTSALDSVLAEWTNVIFKEAEAGEYIFTGPYLVKNLDPGVQVELVPNQYYPNAERRGEIIIKAFKDVSAMKLAFQSGEIDMAFTVTPEVAKMLQDEGLTVKAIDAGYQYFGLCNLEGGLKDKALREAISLGIRRADYLEVLQGGKLPTGIFASYNPFAGKVEVEEDLEKAKAILDEAGYVLNDNGLREKDGEVVKLLLVTYPSRPDLSLIMKLMVTQLKELGLEAETKIVENIDSELAEGNFDLALYAQHTSPTGNPLFFFSQFVQGQGSKNVMHYENEKLDQLLDRMAELPLGPETNELSAEVQQIIYEDLPLIYLVDPLWHVAVSERLADYTPYCGDYYIINDQLFVK